MKNNFEHWVRFKTTLPDDTVTEEDGYIIGHGGKNVRDTICEILVAIGCTVSEKGKNYDHDWMASGNYKSSDFYLTVELNVEDLENIEVLMNLENYRVFRIFQKFKYNTSDYPEFMGKFWSAFKTDVRFYDIRWGLSYHIEDSPWQDEPFMTKPEPS